MLVYFTEAKSNKRIAINTKQVVVVFEVDDGSEFNGHTYIALVSGGVAVTESQLDVVAQINGAF